MSSRALPRNAFPYAALLASLSLVIAYQIKSSVDTVQVERRVSFYIPFTVQSFTNRIDRMAYVANWEEGWSGDAPRPLSFLHSGDEILSINGRAFHGLSVYLRTLPFDERWIGPDWHGFKVTARLADSTVHNVEFSFPHCTCGVPSMAEAISVWVVPPLFCVLLGFATVLLRPKAILAWGFLGALLALSQIGFWDEVYPGFLLTTTPMAWGDPARWFGVGYRALVQSIWPAALLIGSRHFYRHRRGAIRFADCLCALFLLHALLRVTVEVAWSENYRPFVALYRILQSNETGLVAWAFVGVAALGWLLNRRLGMAVGGLALLAILGMYQGAAPVTHGNWVDFVDGTRRFIFDIPTVHNTPGLVVTLFVGGMIVSALLVFRHHVKRTEAFGYLLCLPLLVDCAARTGAFWYSLGPGFFNYWHQFAYGMAGIGLACLHWAILRRTGVPGLGVEPELVVDDVTS